MEEGKATCRKWRMEENIAVAEILVTITFFKN